MGPFNDAYLQGVLNRERVDVGPFSPVHVAHRALAPLIQEWAHAHLSHIALSGSFAKGTANRSGTDVDILVSLRHTCPGTLKEVSESLRSLISRNGFGGYPQTVSIGANVGGIQVDIVPARQQQDFTGDHSIYHRRRDSWRKTNIAKHIALVSNCGRVDEIRLTKIWRDQHGLEFPSFYLELAVIRALQGCWHRALSHRLLTVLDYLAGRFIDDRYVDPANAANVLSDDLTRYEKERIGGLARVSLLQPWTKIIR